MPTTKSKQHPARTGKTRGGSGAHGTKGVTQAQDQGPKWRGGGQKGENEKPSRGKP